MQYISSNEKETENIGNKVGIKLRGGEIIAMKGDLGAGKTAFARGLARGLGITERVTSPTFSIVNEYGSEIPFFHFDVYRLSDSDELYDIGWEDYIERNGVCLVEWSEKVEDIFEDGHIEIYIEKLDDNIRAINIEGIEI